MERRTIQILYRSENNLRRLYRQIEDPPDEVRTKHGEEFQGTVEGKIGLSGLIASLPGVKIEGKATGKAKSFNEEVHIETIDTIDQELAIAERLEDSDLPSPEAIDESSIGTPHYFVGNVSLSNDIREGTITVEHSTEDIKITGSASEENWVSESTLNNLLISSPHEMYGLFIPLDVSSGSTGLEVTAQFILLVLSNDE